MSFKTSFASLLALLALSCAGSVGCAAATDDTGSAEANDTSSAWKLSALGRRPNRDIGDNEQVGYAIDASGKRHAAYQGSDGLIHYVDLSTNQDVTIPTTGWTQHVQLALDPQGQPHLAFSSGEKGVAHASRKNGQWVVEATGMVGSVDALAIDSAGTMHIASNRIDESRVWRATMSTLKAGAAAFEHAEIPGKVEGEIGWGVHALAVDASGGEYMMLDSIMFVDDSPTSSHSTDQHRYFVRRAAGGQFSVEIMDQSLTGSAGSLFIDGAGTIHAVISAAGAPSYIRRGANDTAWSAPEKIHWDGYYTSLAIDGLGRLHVAFTGNESTYMAYAQRLPNGIWGVEYVSSEDAQLPHLAIDANNAPSFAFRNHAGYYLAEPLR